MIFPLKKYTHLGYDYLDHVSISTIHSGVDFNRGRPWEDLGDDVLSIYDGVVEYVGKNISGWGNIIVIYHSDYGVWSRYAHLDSISDGVIVGSSVKEGYKIGELGNTGNSTSPHLHFDIIKRQIRWVSYTRFMSIENIQRIYADPIKYIKNIQKQECYDDVSNWATKSWAKAKELNIITNTDPQDMITAEQLTVILDRCNLLK